MRFEREGAKTIERVSEKQILRGLGYMHGVGKCRIAILTAEDGSYIQVGGRGMCCALERKDGVSLRHFRAFQNEPVVPWTDATEHWVSEGFLLLQPKEFFRIDQVEAAFLSFFRRGLFPNYIHWRDIPWRSVEGSLAFQGKRHH